MPSPSRPLVVPSGADLGGVDLAELLHHVVVVGIAAGADDDGLGVELDDLAVRVNGENADHSAGLVDDELLGGGLKANVEANLLGMGDEAHHELGAQALGALAGVEVPGGVGLAQGNDLLEANALLLEPVDGLSGLVEEGAVKLGIGHVVVVGHEAADDLFDVDLVASLLLPVRTHGEHALRAGEGAAGESLLLKDDDIEAILESLDASGKTGATCADNDDLVLFNLGRLADLFHNVGVIDDRGLLAVSGRVDVAGAGVIGSSGLVGKRCGGPGSECGGCGGGTCGLNKVAASEFHHVPLSHRDVCRAWPECHAPFPCARSATIRAAWRRTARTIGPAVAQCQTSSCKTACNQKLFVQVKTSIFKSKEPFAPMVASAYNGSGRKGMA